MPTIAAMQTSAPFARASAFGAAARQFGARSPSGALLRHSPGRTHPPLAQLQFPRFLRSDLAGVTRFDLSQVYRAPRRPVVVPAERWPRAARERMANPPQYPRPAKGNKPTKPLQRRINFTIGTNQSPAYSMSRVAEKTK
jgi:hypothetical protein